MNPRGKEFQSTRRHFLIQTGATVVAAAQFSSLWATEGSGGGAAKPNSKVNGVQIGLNVPYSFSDMGMSGEDVLKNCVQLGISGVELRTQPVEVFLGLPEKSASKGNPAGDSAASTPGHLAQLRKSVSMDRVREFRKKYETAGVLIEIVKVDGI